MRSLGLTVARSMAGCSFFVNTENAVLSGLTAWTGAPTMGRVYTFALLSGKGGVGKSTLTYELAHAYADAGARVLAVDLDPQSSLTTLFGIAPPYTVADVLAGTRHATATATAARDGLDVLAASAALAGVEQQIATRPARDVTLRRALMPVAGNYDVALIDCPPALGLLTVNALASARAALVVARAEALSIAQVADVLALVDTLRDALAPDLQQSGVLVNAYSGHIRHHADALAAMQAAGWPLMAAQIPHTIRLADDAATHSPLIHRDKSHPAALAIRAAHAELSRWQKRQTDKTH